MLEPVLPLFDEAALAEGAAELSSGAESDAASSDGEFDGVEPSDDPTFSIHRALEESPAVVRLAPFDEPCLPVKRGVPGLRRARPEWQLPLPESRSDVIPDEAWRQVRVAPLPPPRVACAAARARARARAHARRSTRMYCAGRIRV